MLYAILAAIILIADQWVKYWTTVKIVLDTGEASLIPGFVKLVNVHNSGAAFGFLSSSESARMVFIAIAIVFTLVVIFAMAKRVFPSKFANFCCTLAIAGAIGNCIDRFIFGYVVDMFKLEFINFAVFNVADIFLVLACILFIFYLLFGYNGKEEVESKPKKEKKEKKEKKSKKSKKQEDEKEEVQNNPEDEIFLQQIKSEFAIEDEPRPISEKVNSEEYDYKMDITPDDIMLGLNGLDIEEPKVEAHAPEKQSPVLGNADDISMIINNAFKDNVPEMKAPQAEKVEFAPKAEKAPEPDFDPYDFSLESILEEFK